MANISRTLKGEYYFAITETPPLPFRRILILDEGDLVISLQFAPEADKRIDDIGSDQVNITLPERLIPDLLAILGNAPLVRLNVKWDETTMLVTAFDCEGYYIFGKIPKNRGEKIPERIRKLITK